MTASHYAYTTMDTQGLTTTDGYAHLIDSFDIGNEIDTIALGSAYTYFVASCELTAVAVDIADGYCADYQVGFGLKSLTHGTMDFIETSTPSNIIWLEDQTLGWALSLGITGTTIEIYVHGSTSKNIDWRIFLNIKADLTQLPM